MGVGWRVACFPGFFVDFAKSCEIGWFAHHRSVFGESACQLADIRLLFSFILHVVDLLGEIVI